MFGGNGFETTVAPEDRPPLSIKIGELFKLVRDIKKDIEAEALPASNKGEGSGKCK